MSIGSHFWGWSSFWAPQAPDLHCHNAMLSSYEKASQWLMALGFLQMWQAMADVISY